LEGYKSSVQNILFIYIDKRKCSVGQENTKKIISRQLCISNSTILESLSKSNLNNKTSLHTSLSVEEQIIETLIREPEIQQELYFFVKAK
jgi:hypothetical protein